MLIRRVAILKVGMRPRYFTLILALLLIRLFFAFSSSTMVSFYFFFEFSLVPTIFLIIGWGSQVERLQATLYFLLYTIFASLPLLIFTVFFFSAEGAFNFFSGPLGLFQRFSTGVYWPLSAVLG